MSVDVIEKMRLTLYKTYLYYVVEVQPKSNSLAAYKKVLVKLVKTLVNIDSIEVMIEYDKK